jgi:hypothetical protein
MHHLFMRDFEMSTPNVAKHGPKAIILSIIMLFSSEYMLAYMQEKDYLGEPYEWGNRNIIPTKINLAKKLFSANPDRIPVVVVGDSRVERALDPCKFDDFFNNKTITYNIGIPGTGIQAQTAIIKAILKRCNPSFIIYDISLDDFTNHPFILQEDNVTLSTTMGRYYNRDCINCSIDDYLSHITLGRSSLYQYRRQILPKWLNPTPIKEHESSLYFASYQGFVWSNENNHKPTGNEVYDVVIDYQLHPTSRELFLKTIQSFNNVNITFLIVNGPHCYQRRVAPDVQHILEELPIENYLNLNGNYSLANSLLYYDSNHLNYDGAQLYTEYVCNKLIRFFS